jgi:4-amino-4-deoxy-L-arabinose transferase-like glycosyltransferase
MLDVHVMAKLMLWFTWPAWPLALWSLWRWRGQLARGWRYPHLGLPLWFVVVTVGATWFTGLSDRALLTSLPAIATLAALALPTLKRSLGALIDWFTLLFFSFCALSIWVVWLAMQTGTPAKPAANVARFAPEFAPSFSLGALALALAATLAWGALVRWRTGHHRAAIWKSLVLPASGATLCWLLLTSLWLPLVDYARSYAPLVQKVTRVTGPTRCLQYAGLSKSQGAALMHHAQVQLIPLQAPRHDCAWLVMDNANRSLLATPIQSLGWVEETSIKRPTDRDETWVIFRSANNLIAPATPPKN